MIKQKKRTCFTQSGKNYAINCAIQGVRLIWKHKIWLVICNFLWSLTNQNAWFVSSFCTELTLFCTVFEKNCTALNQSKWRNFFMYIINKISSMYRKIMKIIGNKFERYYERKYHKREAMITTRNFLGTKLNFFFEIWGSYSNVIILRFFFSASKVDNNHIVKQIDK